MDENRMSNPRVLAAWFATALLLALVHSAWRSDTELYEPVFEPSPPPPSYDTR